MRKLSRVVCGLVVASIVTGAQTSCSQQTQTEPKEDDQPKVKELNSGVQTRSAEDQLPEPFVVNLEDRIYLNDVVAKRLQAYQRSHPGIKLKCTLNNEKEIYQVHVIPLEKSAVYTKLKDDILDLMYQNRKKKAVKLGPTDKIDLTGDGE